MPKNESKVKQWLTDTIAEAEEKTYHWTSSVLICSDVRLQVVKEDDGVKIQLLAKDSVSITYGDYICDLSNQSIDDIVDIASKFYDDVQIFGIDFAITQNIHLFM